MEESCAIHAGTYWKPTDKKKLSIRKFYCIKRVYFQGGRFRIFYSIILFIISFRLLIRVVTAATRQVNRSFFEMPWNKFLRVSFVFSNRSPLLLQYLVVWSEFRFGNAFRSLVGSRYDLNSLGATSARVYLRCAPKSERLCCSCSFSIVTQLAIHLLYARSLILPRISQTLMSVKITRLFSDYRNKVALCIINER